MNAHGEISHPISSEDCTTKALILNSDSKAATLSMAEEGREGGNMDGVWEGASFSLIYEVLVIRIL